MNRFRVRRSNSRKTSTGMPSGGKKSSATPSWRSKTDSAGGPRLAAGPSQSASGLRVCAALQPGNRAMPGVRSRSRGDRTRPFRLLPANAGADILVRTRRRCCACTRCGGLNSFSHRAGTRGMTASPRIDLDRLLGRLDTFNRIGALAGGGNCRLALSDDDRAGRDLLVRWMRELGLTVTIDAIGNIIGVRGGREDTAPVMFGSHVDTVGTGGRYYGLYCVLAGLV